MRSEMVSWFRRAHTSKATVRAKAKNALLIAQMMGDTSVETIRRHYINLEIDAMRPFAMSGFESADVIETAEIGSQGFILMAGPTGLEPATSGVTGHTVMMRRTARSDCN